MKTNVVRVAMCQLNSTTGAFQANFDKARNAIFDEDADIYVFPECFVSNYAADDMLLNDGFIQATAAWVERWVALSAETGKTLIFGAPFGGRENSSRTYNMVLIAQAGRLVYQRGKAARPNYDVFDDKRYFEQWEEPISVFRWAGNDGSLANDPLLIAPAICEEIWQKVPLPPADIVIAINSSPYAIGKAQRRRTTVLDRIRETRMPLVYVNQVGASDELVFDGGSCAGDANGAYYEMAPFKEGVDVVEIQRWSFDQFNESDPGIRYSLMTERPVDPQHPSAEKYIAACMGLRDYFSKVGIWQGVVLGLSGGADSALVAMMAADVFGAYFVRCITMPSHFTSDDSNNFALRLAKGVGSGINVSTLPIATIYDAFRTVVDGTFSDVGFGLADENLQAQVRGDFLSFYSNRYGMMILSTGNKSELGMGYATLYGDMRGAYNPLGDLYKTEVFDLLKLRYEAAINGDPLFSSMFKTAFGKDIVRMTQDAAEALRETAQRPPSAELRPDQKDSDSLPDYPVLDDVLRAMIDNKESWTNERIAQETGHSLEIVDFVRKKLRQNEFKRNQSCPKPKIHMKSFTKKDWRMPLVNHFAETGSTHRVIEDQPAASDDNAFWRDSLLDTQRS